MSITDQARWAEPNSVHMREPHPLLVRFIEQRRWSGGHALDLACGVGQMGFRFLNRELWPRLRIALRPGGWLLYQTFNMLSDAGH